MTTTTAALPIWQTGREDLPTATTVTGAKRALNKVSGYGSLSRRQRIISAVQLPMGVRVVNRDMGTYRYKGSYAAIGGSHEHPGKGKLRAHDTAEEALADAFERVEFAASLAAKTEAEFPVGTMVPLRAQPNGYGTRYEMVQAEVVAVNARHFRDEMQPGYITVRYGDRDYDLRAKVSA